MAGLRPHHSPKWMQTLRLRGGMQGRLRGLKRRFFLGVQREVELLKGQVEAGKRENEAGKREVELLKEMAALKEMKQLPPPPTAGGDLADMTLLGLAECGLEGWLLKKALKRKRYLPRGHEPMQKTLP